MKKASILIYCYLTDLFADIVLALITQERFFDLRQKSLGFYKILERMLDNE
jgi:hypothetical protein